jgi:hypothetical protein
MRRIAMALMAVAGLVLLGAGPAAAGAGTVSFTQHFHDQVIDQESTQNPCTGDVGTLTLIARNGVVHVTTNANGLWATLTATGDATFVADDPSAPSASGHFAAWDGENVNRQNNTATETFNAVLVGTDGSRVVVHEVAHVNVSADGTSGGVTFDKPTVHCG